MHTTLRGLTRKLAAFGLAPALFSTFSSTASAQFFGGRGFGRGPGFYNRGNSGFYGNNGYYTRGYRGGFGGRGFNQGYGGGGFGPYNNQSGLINTVPYSPMYNNMIPNGLSSPFVGGGFR